MGNTWLSSDLTDLDVDSMTFYINFSFLLKWRNLDFIYLMVEVYSVNRLHVVWLTVGQLSYNGKLIYKFVLEFNINFDINHEQKGDCKQTDIWV